MGNFVYLLTLLACPVGMGVMMWLMMRGRHGQTADSERPAAQDVATKQQVVPLSPDGQLAALRAQLGAVNGQQAAVAARVDRLAAEDRPAEPHGATSEPREPAASSPRRPA